MIFKTPGQRDTQSPAVHVVEAVAEQTDADPLELPPLYHAIDPEALNTAIADSESGKLSFGFAGQFVTVHSDGIVDVSDKPAGGLDQGEHATDD